MANLAYIQDDILHQVYDGDQDGASINDLRAQVEPLIETLQQQGKPVLVMAHASTTGKTSLHARQAVAKMLTQLVFNKAAVVGANTKIRYIANLIIMASAKTNKVKLFNTEAEAKTWLMG